MEESQCPPNSAVSTHWRISWTSVRWSNWTSIRASLLLKVVTHFSCHWLIASIDPPTITWTEECRAITQSVCGNVQNVPTTLTYFDSISVQKIEPCGSVLHLTSDLLMKFFHDILSTLWRQQYSNKKGNRTSAAMFLNRTANRDSFRPCNLNLWTITTCHVDATHLLPVRRQTNHTNLLNRINSDAFPT